jgi:glycine/D-amino acid oxidase-like deaminating enzyme/nitrite reductase/ring-hydroxylating ferredoxin subunit
MRSDAGRTVSWWMRGQRAPRSAPLKSGTVADVCVIGAGIAGLSTAYHLALEGKSVVVLDDGAIGGGASSRTSGHLACALDDRFYRLEHVHGRQGARLAAESHRAAIDRIERIVGEEGIDCEFARVDGYLFAPSGGPAEELAREQEAARRAGLEVERAEGLPVDGHDFGPALRFPRQGQFHVMKYLHGLARATKRRGGRIHNASHVEEIHAERDLLRVAVAGGLEVRAKAVVVATNTPFNDRVTMHTKQAPYRTYVIALELPKGALPDFLAWDTADPYHYIRVAHAADRDVLIVGGEDHKTGQPDGEAPGPFATLEHWARARFAMAGAVLDRWSGQVLEPVDSLGFIGRNPGGDERVFIATGDSGNGLTHGTLAGLILPDLIAGRDNPWAALYDPSRRSLRASGTFLRENLNVARQYAALLSPGEVDDSGEIARGDAAIVRHGIHKVAAYRDDHGALHEHSALCPHLGCVVAWNTTEKTWDCPCHGSRFDKIDGHVLNGPAVAGLRPLDEPRRGKSGAHRRRGAAHGRTARR